MKYSEMLYSIMANLAQTKEYTNFSYTIKHAKMCETVDNLGKAIEYLRSLEL